MYKYFYLIMLISIILCGVISLMFTVMRELPTKIWRYIMYGLMAIAMVSFIGFATTLFLR